MAREKVSVLRPIALVPALFLALTLGLALCGAEPVFASTFTVTPTLVALSAKRSSAVVTVANEGGAEVRIGIAAFTWTESAAGEMGLEPTEEIVVYPPVLVVPPRTQRKVRVGVLDRARVGRESVERSYRIYFEEMASGDLPPASNEIRMLARFGVPVFVTPPKAASRLAVEEEAVSSGRVRFRLTNPGNAHDRIQSIAVKGIGPGGAVVFERRLQGWYLLAGGIRSYTLELPERDCASAEAIVLDARGESLTASSLVPLDTASCRRTLP